jgi:hypothetical protein
MPRFVLLKHTLPPDAARGTHWDLMLEAGDALRTWALDELPTLDHDVFATQLADHRLAYLDYEGPVSGNRGSVERVDRGEYAVVGEAAGRLEVVLLGDRLRGRATLYATTGDQRWRFALRTDTDLATDSAS